MVEWPALTVPVVRDHIRAADGKKGEELRKLIGELGSDVFHVRERATKQLQAAGEAASDLMQESLKHQPTLETRARLEKLLDQCRGPVTEPNRLRLIRSTQVLEQIGTGEARMVLAELAHGGDHLLQTVEARQALERLASR
jgi:hypothetical protein